MCSWSAFVHNLLQIIWKHGSFCFQARLFDEPQLASLCLENIDKNTADALAAEGFTDIDLGIALKYQLLKYHNKIQSEKWVRNRRFMFPPAQTPSWQSWRETRWVYGKCVSSGLRFVGRTLRPKGNSYSPRRKTSVECWEKRFPLFASRSWLLKSLQQVIFIKSLMPVYLDVDLLTVIKVFVLWELLQLWNKICWMLFSKVDLTV